MDEPGFESIFFFFFQISQNMFLTWNPAFKQFSGDIYQLQTGNSFHAKDQALSLWSGSTDSKTLDYQRTKPREYQIVRTHTKATTWIQNSASPNHQQHPVQNPHLNNKQNKNKNPIISRQDYHFTQPCPTEEKQTTNQKTQQKSQPIWSLHKPLDQPQ